MSESPGWRPLVGALVLCATVGVAVGGKPDVPPAAAGRQPDRKALLTAAKTWMYQIDDLGRPGAVAALARSRYPLLVLEPGVTMKEPGDDPAGLIQELRVLPSGPHRLLLAYIDVGQAEAYRAYWQRDWVRPTPGNPGRPDFLLSIDPDGWDGSYQVAFWDERWKAIWLGPDGVVARLARLGFDGIYLDWVDAYQDGAVRRAAARAKRDARMEMIRFIEELRAAGRAVTPDFLVVAQNGVRLIDAAPDRYAKAIDALAVEDTWFNGRAGARWADPKAGDLRDHHDGDDATPSRLREYQKYLTRGLPVFSVDYCVSPKNADRVYREARAAGLVPLVTRVPLSRMTETPPEGS